MYCLHAVLVYLGEVLDERGPDSKLQKFPMCGSQVCCRYGTIIVGSSSRPTVHTQPSFRHLLEFFAFLVNTLRSMGSGSGSGDENLDYHRIHMSSKCLKVHKSS